MKTLERTPGDPEFVEVGPDSVRIAVRYRAGGEGRPTLVWLGGWRSDMLGSKAETLDALAAERGWGALRHDYSGHGESDGDITGGTISRWTEESLAVLDRFAPNGELLLCGSSMGAWIAIRMALALRERNNAHRLLGLVLIAPAPDFVTRLMEPRLTDEQHEALKDRGRFEEHSDYSDEPNVWTRAFMEDGARAAVLTGPLELGVPVHILQGTADEEVPLTHAELLMSYLPADEATMTVVKDGDHRLSRDGDLALLRRVVGEIVDRQ